jgi:hypothetical protein
MAIAQPASVFFESGQDGTWTVELDPEEDITGWEIDIDVRAYNGGTTLISKQSADGSSEIEVTNTSTGVFVGKFSASELTLLYGPGSYQIQAHRVNAGYRYPITDVAPLFLRAGSSTASPTLTNLGEYFASFGTAPDLEDDDAKQYIWFLAASESFLRRICGRQFTYGSRTFFLDGNGTPDILIPETPVNSITSVHLDTSGYWGQPTGSFDATQTLLTAGTHYALAYDDPENTGVSKSGRLRRIGGVWPYSMYRPIGALAYRQVPSVGSIKVVAITGYRLVPIDLKNAVFDLTNLYLQTAADGRLKQSESGEGYSYSLGPIDQEAARLGSVQSIIASYRSGRTFVA